MHAAIHVPGELKDEDHIPSKLDDEPLGCIKLIPRIDLLLDYVGNEVAHDETRDRPLHFCVHVGGTHLLLLHCPCKPCPEVVLLWWRFHCIQGLVDSVRLGYPVVLRLVPLGYTLLRGSRPSGAPHEATSPGVQSLLLAPKHLCTSTRAFKLADQVQASGLAC